MSSNILLLLILVVVIGAFWYLNKNETPKTNVPKTTKKVVEHLDNNVINNAILESSSTPALSDSVNQAKADVSSSWATQFDAKLTQGNGPVQPSIERDLHDFDNLDSGNVIGVTNDEVDKIINERSQRQLEFNNADLLPQEVNKDWFEADFSNARIKIGNDNLINTDRYVVGVNTVGQSLKNPSYDLRPTPPCPKITVSPWNQSTIEPDFNIKPWY